MKIPVFFHEKQLLFHPPFEWDKRGYVPHPESPERPKAILKALQAHPDDFAFYTPEDLPDAYIHDVHVSDLIRVYQNAEEQLTEDDFFFPTFFPKPHQKMADPENLHNTGFYCFDTSTPLGAHTLTSISWAAASAVAAADHVAQKKSTLAYALTRPPGHHADKDHFGGYCYFNHAAIIASHLGKTGRVAIIDIDFHHGDGIQSIFYYDCHVLTTSIHADPTEYFPYFSGFAHEIGLGAGEGFNLNVPVPKSCDVTQFLDVLESIILPKIKTFKPAFLVIAAGFDTYTKDPIGGFNIETADYAEIGRVIGALNLPTVVTQEGGYYLPALGDNAAALLCGLKSTQAIR